jgi:hypothetical protein
MDVDDPRAQSRRGGYGAGNSVGDIVKFQVEKNAIATARQFLDDTRPVTRKEATADFEAADQPSEFIGERARLGCGINV